jgi:hypothetical protein
MSKQDWADCDSCEGSGKQPSGMISTDMCPVVAIYIHRITISSAWLPLLETKTL